MPKRAAAPRAEKKDSTDAAAPGAVPIHVAAPPPPALPFSLGLAILAGGVTGALTSGDPNAALAAAGSAPSALPGQPDNAQLDNAKQETMPDPLSEAPVTQPVGGDLTFAVKLKPEASAGAPAETCTADAAKPAHDPAGAHLDVPVKVTAGAVTPVKDTRHGDLGADGQPAPPRSDSIVRAAAFQVPEKAPSTEAAPAEPPRLEVTKALDTAAIQAPADQPAKVSEPLKDLQIQVGQTPQDKVELRVVERAGEVQVAVRAANSDVAQGLRQGLSDLASRLEQSGFHAETWRPGTSVSAVSAVVDTRQKSTQFQNENSQSQSGGSQQGRQQSSQNQSNRPKWVQELEGTLAGGGRPFTGDSYGISR